jgi:hypothetical protein
MAASRCGAYRGLLNCFCKCIKKVRGASRRNIQKAMLDASIAFDVGTNGRSPDWSPRNEGLRRVSSCYFLLDELSNSDELTRLRGEDGSQTDFDFLTFFLALGGALQEAENPLTAMDAVYLGLVDTVREDVWSGPRAELLAAY